MRASSKRRGKMNTYLVSGEMTISVHTLVQANSENEAIEAAGDHPVVGLCHQCASGNPQEEWCTSGELDGEPLKLTAEEQADTE